MSPEVVKTSRRNIETTKLEKVAGILRAISHPVRLEVIEVLEGKPPQTVAQILSQVDVEQSLLSHHLTKMKDKGILQSHREGKNIFYSLAITRITGIFDCMEHCDFL